MKNLTELLIQREKHVVQKYAESVVVLDAMIDQEEKNPVVVDSFLKRKFVGKTWAHRERWPLPVS